MIKSHFQYVYKLKRKSFFLEILVQLAKALILSALMLVVWQWLHPFQNTPSVVLALLVFLITFCWKLPRLPHKIEPESGLLGLEIKYPASKFSPLESDAPLKAALSHSSKSAPNHAAEAEWASNLEKEKKLIRKMEFARIQMRVTSLFVPLLLVFVFFKMSDPSVETTVDQFKGMVRNFTRGSRLEVVSGRFDEGSPQAFTLGKTPFQITLTSENMLHVVIDTGSDEVSPVVKLKKSTGQKNEEFQTFLASQVRNKTNGLKEPGLFELSFSSPESAELFIPSLYGEKKLASFLVKASPTPVVQVSISTQNPNDPWHDEDPLPLSIQVNSFHPLRIIKLKISSSGKSSYETVANIMKEEEVRYDGIYPFDVRPYVESDLAEIELSVLAEDRAVPKPLTGESRVIKLKVASAYGRYQITLQKLRRVKQSLDDALNSSNFGINPDTLKSFKEAEKISETSPYFDGLDRMNLGKMREDLAKSMESKKTSQLVTLNAELSDFLFEHESLDDRERDRDFFVVARALSRVLEVEEASRPAKASLVGNKIIDFLDGRTERWKKRLERLPQGMTPKEAQNVVSKRMFQKMIQNVVSLGEGSGPKGQKNQLLNNSLKQLANTVSSYRDWIDSLEKAEDELRKNQQQDKQKAMANAANKLKELQRNQGDISGRLDRADVRQDEISKEWNATASAQDKNKKSTQSLVSEMVAMSPEGAKRLEAASEAMGETMNSGSAKNFAAAESMSDMAARLLNQSQKSLQEKQQEQGREPRKRRQISGDNSFGTQVSGNVDLKRDYTVDKKYREEILDSINETPAAKDDLPLINNYLRKTVR
ncbi:MAG: hypothetical protein WCI18_09725 [Pseudomonadota bacterium]